MSVGIHVYESENSKSKGLQEDEIKSRSYHSTGNKEDRQILKRTSIISPYTDFDVDSIYLIKYFKSLYCPLNFLEESSFYHYFCNYILLLFSKSYCSITYNMDELETHRMI